MSQQPGQQQNPRMLPPHHTQPPSEKKVVRFEHVVCQVPRVYPVDGGEEDEFLEKEQIHELPHRRYQNHECYLDCKTSKRWSNDGSRSPNDVSPPMYPKRRNSLSSASQSGQPNRMTMLDNSRSQDGRMEHDERIKILIPYNHVVLIPGWHALNHRMEEDIQDHVDAPAQVTPMPISIRSDDEVD
eukprot:scaffold26340_cov103-Cylindrotheca_fusiformis.AAC.4